MGVLFNDPDVDIEDIYWFNALVLAIEESLCKNEGLISIESIKQLDGTDLKTYSCYVELHRNGFIELWPIFKNICTFSIVYGP